MKQTSDGFLRPHGVAADGTAPHKTLDCPGRRQVAPMPGLREDPLWGPVQDVWQGWARDPEIRFRGASGGAISALVLYLCQSGRVDAVLQCGPDPKEPSKTAATVSETRLQILHNAGSRYGPSAPLSAIRDLMESGLRYAVVGKPCDIEGLARLRTRDSDFAKSFPVLISFFCAGVPSQNATDTLLERLDVEPAELWKFRYRGHGWPGRATAVLKDHTERSMSYRESWGEVLSPQLQTRCKLCADGIGMSADIVCADAWVTDDDGYPSFDESAGVSAILARTDLGRRVVRAAKEFGALETEEFDIRTLDQMQPGQLRRREAVQARLWGVGVALGRVPEFKAYNLWRLTRRAGIRRTLSEGIGSFLRVLLGRI